MQTTKTATGKSGRTSPRRWPGYHGPLVSRRVSRVGRSAEIGEGEAPGLRPCRLAPGLRPCRLFPGPRPCRLFPPFSRSKPPLSRSKPPLVQETGFFVVGGGPACYCWSQSRPLGPDGRAPPPPAFAHAPGPHWLPTCQNAGTHPAQTLAVLLLPLPRLPLSRQLVSIWLCSAWAKLLVLPPSVASTLAKGPARGKKY